MAKYYFDNRVGSLITHEERQQLIRRGLAHIMSDFLPFSLYGEEQLDKLLPGDTVFSLTRDEIREFADSQNWKNHSEVTEEELDEICRKLGDNLCENGFWDIVKVTIDCVKEE